MLLPRITTCSRDVRAGGRHCRRPLDLDAAGIAAAGCAPSAPPQTLAMNTPATPMPTEAQRAEAARVERVWPGCQVEAENATAPMENATERKQEYVHVLTVCVAASN